jgi:hypothetical protein
LLLRRLARYYSSDMEMKDKNPEELKAAAEAILEETAGQLRQVLVELASRLRPFPPFLNMVSIQALELEPPLRPSIDRGCVVVCPDGEICQLDLRAIPGAAGVADVEQVEEFRELELPAEEYVIYATEAIRALAEELRRRGR